MNINMEFIFFKNCNIALTYEDWAIETNDFFNEKYKSISIYVTNETLPDIVARGYLKLESKQDSLSIQSTSIDQRTDWFKI